MLIFYSLSNLLIVRIILSVIVGAGARLNQTSLRKLMLFDSRSPRRDKVMYFWISNEISYDEHHCKHSKDHLDHHTF